ncbi:MAG: Lrp/AsnC family transcriptional regulator [Armatimonadota bacterium]|nr:Lrp/AsnC family transcriptional regulator [Armatimonadota bacterium]
MNISNPRFTVSGREEPDDGDILSVLEQDARLSPHEIASMTGRTEEAVKTAIARLEEGGVIRRYKTVVDWDRVSAERVMAFVDVKVTPARNVGFDDVAERIYRFPEVRSVYLMSGDYDLRVMVEGRHIRDIALFVSDRLASIDRVLATATHFLLKKYKEEGVIFVDSESDDRLEVSP